MYRVAPGSPLANTRPTCRSISGHLPCFASTPKPRHKFRFPFGNSFGSFGTKSTPSYCRRLGCSSHAAPSGLRLSLLPTTIVRFEYHVLKASTLCNESTSPDPMGLGFISPTRHLPPTFLIKKCFLLSSSISTGGGSSHPYLFASANNVPSVIRRPSYPRAKLSHNLSSSNGSYFSDFLDHSSNNDLAGSPQPVECNAAPISNHSWRSSAGTTSRASWIRASSASVHGGGPGMVIADLPKRLLLGMFAVASSSTVLSLSL